MDKVYFLSDEKKLEKISSEFLSSQFPTKGKILVKIHFGEPGNRAAFKPQDIKPILGALNSRGVDPILFDSPVAYPSPRGTVEGHLKVAKQKGFGDLGKILISNQGKKVKTKDMEVEVCRPLIEAENVLVISHVKGHMCSGFGGAIKNLGMGGVTRESKILEHAFSKPKRGEDCRGCGICVRLCPVGAIKMIQEKAVVNIEECAGCSICQVKCPHKVLIPKRATFDDLLAQAASAVIKNFSDKVFYINFVKNIVKNCDCGSFAGKKLAKDVGILFSQNPVAIDKASVDLVSLSEGEEVFEKNLHKDPLAHVRFASKYTGWPMKYELARL